MVGESLLVIRQGPMPFTSIYKDRVHKRPQTPGGILQPCTFVATEEQKNGKANEQFKEVAIETVTRRFQ